MVGVEYRARTINIGTLNIGYGLEFEQTHGDHFLDDEDSGNNAYFFFVNHKSDEEQVIILEVR